MHDTSRNFPLHKYLNNHTHTPSTQKTSFLYRNGRRKIGGIRENKKKNSNRENLSLIVGKYNI